MKKGIIDRFEGDCALIEVDGKIVEIPKNKLPKEVKEGDQIVIDGDVVKLGLIAKELKGRLTELLDEVWDD